MRIFPDQIHVDTHEPALTAAERDAGMAYWRASPRRRRPSAWDGLCAAAGPPRAAWIARGADSRRTSASPATAGVPRRGRRVRASWSAAAVATALPERWVVIGVQGRQRAVPGLVRARSPPRSTCRPCRSTTPSPSPTASSRCSPPRAGSSTSTTAEAAGMAVRVTGVDARRRRGPPVRARRRLDAHARRRGDGDRRPARRARLHRRPIGDRARHADEHHGRLRAPARRPPRRSSRPRSIPHASGRGGCRSDAAPTGYGERSACPPTRRRCSPRSPAPPAASRTSRSRLADALWESTLGSLSRRLPAPERLRRAASRVREHVAATCSRRAVPGPARSAASPTASCPSSRRGVSRPAADGFEASSPRGSNGCARTGTAATARAPRLGRTADLDADLTAVLQTTPLAATLRFRHVVGPLTVNATHGLERHAAAQEHFSELARRASRRGRTGPSSRERRRTRWTIRCASRSSIRCRSPRAPAIAQLPRARSRS